jgi:hypothetical protein
MVGADASGGGIFAKMNTGFALEKYPFFAGVTG